MHYKINPDKYISRAIYNLASGANREFLEHFISLFGIIIKDKAISVCTNIDSNDTSNSFDRGYVKGLNEARELLVNSYMKGEKIHYGKEKPNDKGPKIV